MLLHPTFETLFWWFTCFTDPLKITFKCLWEVFSHSQLSKRFSPFNSGPFITELSERFLTVLAFSNFPLHDWKIFTPEKNFHRRFVTLTFTSWLDQHYFLMTSNQYANPLEIHLKELIAVIRKITVEKILEIVRETIRC